MIIYCCCAASCGLVPPILMVKEGFWKIGEKFNCFLGNIALHCELRYDSPNFYLPLPMQPYFFLKKGNLIAFDKRNELQSDVVVHFRCCFLFSFLVLLSIPF